MVVGVHREVYETLHCLEGGISLGEQAQEHLADVESLEKLSVFFRGGVGEDDVEGLTTGFLLVQEGKHGLDLLLLLFH